MCSTFFKFYSSLTRPCRRRFTLNHFFVSFDFRRVCAWSLCSFITSWFLGLTQIEWIFSMTKWKCHLWNGMNFEWNFLSHRKDDADLLCLVRFSQPILNAAHEHWTKKIGIYKETLTFRADSQIWCRCKCICMRCWKQLLRIRLKLSFEWLIYMLWRSPRHLSSRFENAEQWISVRQQTIRESSDSRNKLTNFEEKVLKAEAFRSWTSEYSIFNRE